jgi:hypothetical protein
MLWFAVYCVLGIGLVVFVVLLIKGIRAHLEEGQRLPLSDYVAVAGAALNVALLVIAVGSLHVAITTYQEAERSGKEQTRALQLSRDALSGVSQTLDKQAVTLEKSRQALESSVTTAVAQQKLLSQSVANSKKQLGILQAEWTRELEQPDVHLALFYTDEFSVAVSNAGKKIARDTFYQGMFWNLSRPQNGMFQFASAKGDEVKYIRPGGGFAPTVLQWHYGHYGSDSPPPQEGDKLFGYMTVQCPDCVQERLYWIFFAVGGDGIYREGRWGEYSFEAKDAIASASRLMNSPGLFRLSRGNLQH